MHLSRIQIPPPIQEPDQARPTQKTPKQTKKTQQTPGQKPPVPSRLQPCWLKQTVPVSSATSAGEESAWLPRGIGAYLVMMARWGGLMQAPMKSTTFSCRVCRYAITSLLKAFSWSSLSRSMSMRRMATSPCQRP